MRAAQRPGEAWDWAYALCGPRSTTRTAIPFLSLARSIQLSDFTVAEVPGVGLVLASYMNFLAAFWSGSGHTDGVPDDLVERLDHGMSSAGDLRDLDREIERVLAFRDAGITELALRLGDDPLDALAIIGQHVLPALQ